MSELVFSDELKVHTNGTGEGCPGKVLSKRTGIEQKGEKAAGGSRKGGCTAAAQQLGCLSRGRSSVAGVAAAAEPLPLPRARRKTDVHAFCWQESGAFLQKLSFTLANLCSGLTLPNREAFPLATIHSES